MGVEMMSAESASRPRYAPLSPVAGTQQIIVADRDGLEAALNLLTGAPAAFVAASVLIVAGGDSVVLAGSPPAGRCIVAADTDGALAALAGVLADADMGARLYLAGGDPMLSVLRRGALAAGLSADAIQAEACGAPRRRVRCMHCGTITEDVVADRLTCSSCGLELAVRDHYSQRLAAYQGVWTGPGPVSIVSTEAAQ